MKNAFLRIPFTRNYILLKLSRREFSLFNLFHIKKRTSVYWARLLSFAGMPIFYVLVFFLYCFTTGIAVSILIVLHPDLNSGIIEVPAVDFVFKGIAIAGTLIYLLFIALTNWRINYDILITYGMQKHAMWASVLNVFCPIIMIIFSYLIMNKSPNYDEKQI